MTDKKSSESRRKLLKSIAAGSGAIVAGKSLPESWSRPVVDSVMLPAHAQTSITGAGTYAGATTIASINQNDSLIAKISDSLVRPANANGVSTLLSISYCIKVSEDGKTAIVQVIVVVKDNSLICEPEYVESAMSPEFEVTLGAPAITIPSPIEYGCPSPPHARVDIPPTIAVNKPSNGLITGTTEWEGGNQTDSFTIPVGNCDTHDKKCLDEGCDIE